MPGQTRAPVSNPGDPIGARTVDIDILQLVQADPVNNRAVRCILDEGNGTTWWVSPTGILSKSLDRGATFGAGPVYTGTGTYTDINGLRKNSDGSYLMAATTASQVTVLRSTNNCVSWTPVTGLALQASPVLSGILAHLSWCECQADAGSGVNDGTLFLAEYGAMGDNGAISRIWRSDDHGATWVVVYSTNAIRHFHSVQQDPYNLRNIWVCAGDDDISQSWVGFSEDGCQTFTKVAQADDSDTLAYSAARAVGVAFTDESILYGSDTPDGYEKIPFAKPWAVDRLTGRLSAQIQDYMDRGVRYPTVWDDGSALRQMMAMFSSVELGANAQTAGWQDDHVRIFTAQVPFNTIAAPFRWPRTQDTSNSAAPVYVGPIGSDGSFWVTYVNLAGTTNESSRYVSLRMRMARSKVGYGTRGIDWYERYVAAQAERGWSFPINETFAVTGAFTTQKRRVFVAQHDLAFLAGGQLMVDSTHAASATDYPRVKLQLERNGVQVRTIYDWSTQIQAGLTPGVAVATTSTTWNKMAKGDALYMEVAKINNPAADLVRPCISFKTHRLNSILTMP